MTSSRSMLILVALVCALSLGLIVGCDKGQDTPVAVNAAPAPATQPAPIATASAPAQPTGSMLTFDGVPQWFPPARLYLSTQDGKVVARLYSDDPATVLTGKTMVNSYDIRMVLADISSPADITRTIYISRSASMEKQDTPYGIFLNNQQDVLQPYLLKVMFIEASGGITVKLAGQFSQFHISDQNPNPAPTFVQVRGELSAQITEKQ